MTRMAVVVPVLALLMVVVQLAAAEEKMEVGDADTGGGLDLGDFKVDAATAEQLKQQLTDSDRVDKASVVTSTDGNVEQLLRDAGFAPSPPWPT